MHYKIKNNIIDSKLLSNIYFIVNNWDFFVALLDNYFKTEQLYR